MSKLDLPDIIDQHATTDQIHALLKLYKEEYKDDIRLTGSKSELIGNLLSAMDKRIISFDKIFQLVQDSEEYGNQYIYLFKSSSNPSVDYNNGESIKRSMINSSEYSKFPKVTLIPPSIQWADFRYPNRGVENSWLAKLYDVKEKEFKSDESYDSNTGRRIITYETKTSRVTYIIYWNGNDHLEYRISRTIFDSSKGLSNSLLTINSKISDGVDINRDFIKIDLSKTIQKFLTLTESNESIYVLLSAKLKDSEDGIATFKTYSDHRGDLLSESSRKNAIKAYLDNNGEGKGVVVRFLAEGSNGDLSRDLNVVLGRDDVNQIIIPAKINPKDYNYVRRKIKDFS